MMIGMALLCGFRSTTSGQRIRFPEPEASRPTDEDRFSTEESEESPPNTEPNRNNQTPQQTPSSATIPQSPPPSSQPPGQTNPFSNQQPFSGNNSLNNSQLNDPLGGYDPYSQSRGQSPPSGFNPSPNNSFAFAGRPSVPNMFGDFLGGGSELSANDGKMAFATIPSPSSRLFKAAEDNSPFPRDRIFAGYNYFDDAFVADNSSFNFEPGREESSVHRVSLGFEKTFLSNAASIEVRLPFFNSSRYNSVNFAINSRSGIGNVQIASKFLLPSFFAGTTTCCLPLVSGGLATSLPTGSDVTGSVNNLEFRIDNRAVHLLPYVGYFHTFAQDRAFLQGFAQLDIDVRGNAITVRNDVTDSVIASSNVRDESLFFLDFGLGYWAYYDPCSPVVQAVATLFEVHYSGTLHEGEFLSASDPGTKITLGDIGGRLDLITLTFGLHAQMGEYDGRVGFVLPVTDARSTAAALPNNPFDWEIGVQLNRRF